MATQQTLFSLALLALLALPLVAAKNARFLHWYPTYGPDFQDILTNNCSVSYNKYLKGTGHLNKACPYVVDCILTNTRESYKANMASASVVLGLTPAILTLLGCGTAELSLLSTRRPFLSICLAIGSPSVAPVHTFEYSNPFVILQTKEGRRLHSRKSALRKALAVTVQYLLAFAAIANVATVSYDLGVKSLFNFTCNQAYLAFLWAFLAPAIQVSGSIAFRLRFKVVDIDAGDGRRKRGRFVQRLINEFSPCSTQGRSSILWKRETTFFLIWSWTVSAVAACHILFGTLAFSSLLFIAVKDALTVATRFIASAIVCRAILVFELSGMRETTLIEEERNENLRPLLASRHTPGSSISKTSNESSHAFIPTIRT
ncbi:hypothetical protein FGG08_007481 [Glutinoglossum americanum]|uniref:Uncharacterized protein n=1 Tax=Glutinoglossum americanum TaxID=1670608 RepID=A0A9P8HTT8_9PEZI|nr:hypothetical protein FGG08_007481 [Glutinoglossum americanum]